MNPIMLRKESKVRNKPKTSFNEGLALLGLSAVGVVALYAWVTVLWWVLVDGVTRW